MRTRTLYREFISATLLILGISVLVGFILAHVVYQVFTKDTIAKQNLATAEQIVRDLEAVHTTGHAVQAYLESVGRLGYQLLLTNGAGEDYAYGEPFQRSRLPEDVVNEVLSGSLYTGNDGVWERFWMMGHFSNDIRNTVGRQVRIGDHSYALFVKPNGEILNSEFHVMLEGFIAATAFVSLLGVVMMARRLIQPISALSEATKAITSGDYSYALTINRQDELGQLAGNFLLMQERLKHNDAARKAFISNVSHDFQSPLMNIQGYADLLLTPELDEKERLQYAGIVSDEARRLSNLTKQLLLITSLDQSGYPVKKREIRLDRQIKESVKKYQWSLEDRSLTVSYKLDEAVLYADSELLQIVWDNLLTNAIKYNRPNGHIHISCEADAEWAAVTFADTGIGLTEEAAGQVFERFYRVDSTRKKDGTGLGLSIVKEIVTLLDGTIALQSELHQGTAISIRLPIR